MNFLEQLKNEFVNKDLFDQALTHRSWVNEHKGERHNNERLEFLGDAVLEYVVSNEIYLKYPDKEEGFLTALRANIVNTASLANFATNINLGQALFLSRGEEDSGGRTNLSLLADTVEAIIGAVFLDRGLAAATDFIDKSLLLDLTEKANSPLKDGKSRLQEYVQSKSLGTPKYKVIKETGPDHNKNFEVEVLIGNEVWGKGEGKSKSTAEQSAALQALAKKVE